MEYLPQQVSQLPSSKAVEENRRQEAVGCALGREAAAQSWCSLQH